MTAIADDFNAIAARLKQIAHPFAPKIADAPEPVCPVCEGGGWECYGLGFGDPYFRECSTCRNPEDLPCP